MLIAWFNNLFEQAFLWAKNKFNNWVKTNSEATIREIGQRQAKFSGKLAIVGYLFLLVIVIILIRLNLNLLVLPVFLLLTFKLPLFSIIKAFQFHFIKISKIFLCFLLVMGIGINYFFGTMLAFCSPELREKMIVESASYDSMLREIITEKIHFLNYLDLSEPTISNYCFWESFIMCLGITIAYLGFCVLAGIYLYISLLEAWTIKIIAMLLAGKKAIPQGIMLVIICVLSGKIGHYLLEHLLQQKIGLF